MSLGYAKVHHRVLPRMVSEHRRRNVFWDTAPLVICWSIWKERNCRVFENVELDIARLKEDIFQTLRFWCTEVYSSTLDSFVEIVENFLLCNSFARAYSLCTKDTSPVLMLC